MSFPSDYKHDVFIMQRISSYAWASWKDRWNKCIWNIDDYYPSFLFNIKERKGFAKCGDDRPLMLDAQVCGKVNSWAIRFEYSMFTNNMYSVLPCLSRTVCSGNDGSGTHSKAENHIFDTISSDGTNKIVLEHLTQDERIRNEFIKPYKNNWKRKMLGNIDFVFSYFIQQLFDRSKRQLSNENS